MSGKGLDHTGATADGGRWDRLAALFEGALARSASERDVYVAEHCRDAADAVELRALLAAYESEPGPVERVMAAIGSADHGGWRDAAPRTQVGPYELIREIGRGGMGVVYLARRADGLYQRQVALKLSRWPVVDVSLRSRFMAERDILAGLAHPNIATLYDGGVTDDGLPYFTMEYVEGLPIDAYCDDRRLDLRARIQLFLRTCAAVAAAHRALVVHRDLKPTNVLVTAAGEVKLLDFGIAKLLASNTPEDRQDTATQSRLMTPAYASPEQVQGAPVSTATDVYALGLLLYELLCGRRAQRFDDGTVRLEDVVVHGDPLPMADAIARGERGDSAPTVEAIARARQTTPARLGRALRGDLARITGMALRKDPDRRYATAAHLAEDLERYLAGRPVLASPPSRLYRAARFARRHRLGLAAAAIAVAILVSYTALTIQHARDMEQAAARERQEAMRAREVADFVVGLFDASDPNVVQNREAPLGQMLEQGVQRANQLGAQPQLQARLLNAIGRVYFNLGQFDEAEALAERALAASRAAVGDSHPDVARDYRLLGLVTGALGRQPDAAGLFRKALDIHRATDAGGIETATDTHHLGYALVQSRQIDEGERHIVAALEARRTLMEPGHEDIATSLSGLAFVRGRQGRPRESSDLYREALALRVARLGDRHPEVARARQNLAVALGASGAFDEAEQQMTQALAVYRAVYGERHPSIATTLNNLGTLASQRRRNSEALGYFRASFEMRRELHGPGHPSTLLAQANLGSILARTGSLAESEAVLREVLSHSGASDVAAGTTRAQLTANLAYTMLLRGRAAEAEAAAREAVALTPANLNPLSQASIRATHGQALMALGRFAEAVESLQRALDIRQERLDADHPDLIRSRQDVEEARRRLAQATPAR